MHRYIVTFLNQNVASWLHPKSWQRVLALSVALWVSLTVTVMAAEPPERSPGAALFETHCVGCHPGGGNIIRRGKTLKLRALQRNQVDSVDAIATIVTDGKNNMSAYGDQLSATEIEAVSTYIWEQAQQNWR